MKSDKKTSPANTSENFKETLRGEREHKDRFFCHFFARPENALSLAVALLGVAFTSASKICDITLKNVLFKGQYNDLAFTIDEYCIVIEHQTTLSSELVLRIFSYFLRLFGKFCHLLHIDLHRKNDINWKGFKFYVFYHGKAMNVDSEKLTLTKRLNLIKRKNNIDITVNVINISHGYNMRLKKKCKPLADYVTFIEKINSTFNEIKNELFDKGMARGEILGKAIKEAINFCIVNDIMASYLEEFRVEVFEMLNTEFSVEMEIESLLEGALEESRKEGEIKGELKGKKKGKIEGKKKGKIEAKTEIALKMLNSNFPVTQINDLLGLPIDKIEKLKKSNGKIYK